MEGLSDVVSLAKVVHGKYESVKALKPECKWASQVADAVRTICDDLKRDLALRPDPLPLGKPLFLRQRGD